MYLLTCEPNPVPRPLIRGISSLASLQKWENFRFKKFLCESQMISVGAKEMQFSCGVHFFQTQPILREKKQLNRFVKTITVNSLTFSNFRIFQVATRKLKSGLLQLVICRLVTSFDNHLATSLLTTCNNKLVVNKLSQAM